MSKLVLLPILAILVAAPTASIAAPTTQHAGGGVEDAIAAMKAQQFEKAKVLLEKELKNSSTPSREVIVSLAIVDVRQRVNVMRAVKLLNDYVAASPSDETAVNVLGKAISIAELNRSYARTPLFADAQESLSTAINSLERTKPRMRKWGEKWMNDNEFASIDSQLNQAKANVKRATTHLEAAKQNLEDAKKELRNIPSVATGSEARSHASKVKSAQAKVRAAEKEVDRCEQALDDANKAMPKPPWPEVFDPVDG